MAKTPAPSHICLNCAFFVDGACTEPIASQSRAALLARDPNAVITDCTHYTPPAAPATSTPKSE